MRQKSWPEKQPAEDAIRDIRRATRRHFSAEEKIRTYWKGCAGRRASPNSVGARASPRRCTMAGRKSSWRPARGDSLAGDTARAATSDEVKDLRREAQALKEVVADLTLENRLLKKSMIADG